MILILEWAPMNAGKLAAPRESLFQNLEMEPEFLFLEQHAPVDEQQRANEKHTHDRARNPFPRESSMHDLIYVARRVTPGENHDGVADEFSREEWRDDRDRFHFRDSSGGKQRR